MSSPLNSDNGHTPDEPLPPAGVKPVDAKICIGLYCARCHAPICRLSRKTWFPIGVDPNALLFADPDPEDRLDAIGRVGIAIPNRVVVKEWDYPEKRLNVYLHPIHLHPALEEEHVALAIGLLREKGWEFEDEPAKEWATRWGEHHIKMTDEQLAKMSQPQMICIGVKAHGDHPQGAPQLTEDEEEPSPEEVAQAMSDAEEAYNEEIEDEVRRRVKKMMGRKAFNKQMKKWSEKDAKGKKRKRKG